MRKSLLTLSTFTQSSNVHRIEHVEAQVSNRSRFPLLHYATYPVGEAIQPEVLEAKFIEFASRNPPVNTQLTKC